VKNDHLGFEILYIWQGIVKKYRPDFPIRLANGVNLVLEVKGQDTQENRSKRQFLDEWVTAVNEHGGFGVWRAGVVLQPKEVVGILRKHASAMLAGSARGIAIS
jgi:type III restriction enzyme